MSRSAQRPAFVTGYQYDIFVSYAHVDDFFLSGASHGWVSTLVANLEKQLAQKLGRKYASPWMDLQLAGNVPLTPSILKALRQTATLVVVVSPGYLASEWCSRERQAFLELVKERLDIGSRVFVVEYDRVDRSKLPKEFRDLLGYRFWVDDGNNKAARILGMPVPVPEEHEYYTLLNNLSYEIAIELQRLNEVGAAKPTGVTGNATAPTPAVFLAEVTDDLDYQREEVKGYLLQAGLTVLPTDWYPHDELPAYQHAISEDLRRSKLFVQLLSGVAGRKPPGWPLGHAGVQYQCAKGAGISILQWRSRELDLSSVRDVNHQELLESNTVRAVGIEEFKRGVVDEAKKEPAPLKPERSGDLVFVNTDFPDWKLAEEVYQELLKYDVGAALPLKQGEPSVIRKDFEANLSDCDGLIVVYGETDVTWVRNQLRQIRKILAQRGQPIRCFAVCEGPPSEKEEIAFSLPRLKSLNFRKGLDERALLDFVQCLKA
jgi:TIR domain